LKKQKQKEKARRHSKGGLSGAAPPAEERRGFNRLLVEHVVVLSSRSLPALIWIKNDFLGQADFGTG
jgi:hypothetical protein